jgi:FtsP/CotA-like multicopper oxidase with cupredoxin domain
MDRRYFLYYSTVATAYLFTGCEEQNDMHKIDTHTHLSLEKTQNATDGMLKEITPFTEKLKIPREINFSQIRKAEFVAQKSQVNIFLNEQTGVLTFQGDLPNPTIRISNGDAFDLNFTNKLPDDTTIHWHGVIVPDDMDGHPKDAIAYNQAKHYHYMINQNAGTFWYHMHPHGKTGQQIYFGLSGFYIIEDKIEKKLDLPKGEFELPLVIQDRRFDEKYQLFYKDKNVIQDNNGVMGNVILVNATPFPYHEVKTQKYRLRILNGSSVRTYKLAFDNIEQFTLIGTDAGLIEEPISVNSIILGVAERIDIIIDFKDKNIGDAVTLKTLGFKDASKLILNPDYPSFDAQMDIIQFRIAQKIDNTATIPKKLTSMQRLKEEDAVKTRTITMEIVGDTWTLDKKPYDMYRIDQKVKLGTIEIWELKNAIQMAHPFHIHGVHFQVLDRDGEVEFPTDKGWKDTIIVMPFETVRIIIHFTMPGLFLYHCHILEHEDHAMMANFLVE